ncbi:DUF2628 domain-containing protein [Ectobacillus ponti]|uniref:DUF2628 domain-containing protein n=1 Tax=Ectobacillus ponti TaxID=2961894 RepID=A0AA42BPA0_9BACI|nr:DUF2628 domain-containing protein [Ectobacillus ponti]MCP8968890.1 DUF2628 domain-containing protein [Ectobacillus ponti]
MKTEDIHRFAGKNAGYYERAWRKKKRVAWNSAAFLFHAAWLGFRKMYLYAILFFLLLTVAHALAYAAGWNYALPIINITIPALLVVLAAMAGLGLFGNHLYRLHAQRKAGKAAGVEEEAKHFFLQAAGGTSWLGVLFVVCLGVVAHVASHVLFPTQLDIIRTVKNSSLYNYPLYEIGETFEEYFQDPSWTYSHAPDGLEMVEFHGTDKEYGRVDMQFLVDYRMKEIEPYSLKVSGKERTEKQMGELLDRVFHVETPFELDDQLDEGSKKSAM